MPSFASDTVLSLGRREDHLARLRADRFDLLVVGGGITGAGIALDAASRGLSVGLLEKGDFSVGTSSRSTKLVHGGLRYLAQYEFGLTREALAERAILADLAPGLVEWLPFVLPMIGGPVKMAWVGLGLLAYDVLANRRAPTLHRRLNRSELRELAPGLDPRGLLGAYVYSDCRTDDSRLTLEVLRSAVARGAVPANYAEVTTYLKAASGSPTPQVVGVEAVDRLCGERFEVRAKKVILAAGVWVDEMLKLDDPQAPPRILPAKGVHLVVPRCRLGFDVALFMPTAPDGRLVFVVPWLGETLIGTTDTEYQQQLEAPEATAADVDYLLASVNSAFPDANLTRGDVISVQAGLRPLVSAHAGSTDAISREDKIVETASGLIAIVGGKLTIYRRMAERVVSLAYRRLRESGHLVADVGCLTDRIGLGAFAPGPMPTVEAVNLEADTLDHLKRSYGRNAREVARIASERPDLAQRLVPGQPNVLAEVVYAARHDLAQTVADVLARRAHVVQLDWTQGRPAAAAVARLLCEEHGWDQSRVAVEAERFESDIRQFTPIAVE